MKESAAYLLRSSFEYLLQIRRSLFVVVDVVLHQGFYVRMPCFLLDCPDFHSFPIMQGCIGSSQKMWRELQISLADPPLPGLLADLVDSIPETVIRQGSDFIVCKGRDCIEEIVFRARISCGNAS